MWVYIFFKTAGFYNCLNTKHIKTLPNISNRNENEAKNLFVR